MLAAGEPASFRVAHASGQRDGFSEIHAHFSGSVGVRTERDRHIFATGEPEQVGGGIDFAAILSQAGGVQLDGTAGLGGGGDKFLVKRAAILGWAYAKFFRQIRMADNLE
jgi:hypothetical protein